MERDEKLQRLEQFRSDLPEPDGAEADVAPLFRDDPSLREYGAQRSALDEQMGQALRDVAVPVGLKERLAERIQQERRSRRRRRWLAAGLGTAAVAASIVLVAWLAPFTSSGWTEASVHARARAVYHFMIELDAERCPAPAVWPKEFDAGFVDACREVEFLGGTVHAYRMTANNRSAVLVVIPTRWFPEHFSFATDSSGKFVIYRVTDEHVFVAIVEQERDLDLFQKRQPLIG